MRAITPSVCANDVACGDGARTGGCVGASVTALLPSLAPHHIRRNGRWCKSLSSERSDEEQLHICEHLADTKRTAAKAATCAHMRNVTMLSGSGLASAVSGVGERIDNREERKPTKQKKNRMVRNANDVSVGQRDGSLASDHHHRRGQRPHARHGTSVVLALSCCAQRFIVVGSCRDSPPQHQNELTERARPAQ